MDITMINAYLDGKKYAFQGATTENESLLKRAIWIDLLNPSEIEEKQVEKSLELDIPTREEMREIELSSRLYRDNGNLFMTTLMIACSDSPDPKLDSITMILTPKQLITVRYIEPQSFKLFFIRLKKMDSAHQQSSVALFIELLDTTVDRLADILEMVGHHLDDSSQTIFRSRAENKSVERLNYRQLLQHIGAYGDLNSKARESLITFNRLISFFGQIKGAKLNEDLQPRLVTISKDIESLSNHADFLSTKVNFLLDATLGMVNIDQNNTIKIVSVAAVVFLPPTLIASIYGMNFKFIPELSWYLGYPIAIGLMILAAWLPYKYFKRRGWL
jgi:magnesium transporter